MDNAVLKKLMKELASLTQSPPDGVTLVPNDADISLVSAIIEGPKDTPYEEGRFRISLKLPNDYPLSPPKGHFLTKIFHPNVSLVGEICVNTLKKDWTPTLGIRDVLLTIKCLLIEPNPESALNEEAGKMLLEAYDDYRARAKSWTKIHASGKKDREAVLSARSSSSSSSTIITSVVSTTVVADDSATHSATASTTVASNSLTTSLASATTATTATATTITTAATTQTAVVATVSSVMAEDVSVVSSAPRGGDKENSDTSNNAASSSLSAGANGVGGAGGGGSSPPIAKKSKPVVAKAKSVNRRL
jgi:ubiquitin-conjugating enzyme E2 S